MMQISAGASASATSRRNGLLNRNKVNPEVAPPTEPPEIEVPVTKASDVQQEAAPQATVNVMTNTLPINTQSR